MSYSELNIVIPCYNPPLNWEKGILSSFLELKSRLKDVSIGVVLVNDGSDKHVKTENINFLKENIPDLIYIAYSENKGKGYALRKGVTASTSKYNIFTDVDFPYELDSMVAIFNSLKSGSDVSLGSRDDAYYHKTPFFRKLISKLFRKLMAVLLKLKVTDTQCGLKGFNEKGKEEFLKTAINRFLFDLEFVKRCSENDSLAINAIPVTLKPNVIFSQVKIKILLTELLNFIFILVKK